MDIAVRRGVRMSKPFIIEDVKGMMRGSDRGGG
jgi:hypothetical protein